MGEQTLLLYPALVRPVDFSAINRYFGVPTSGVFRCKISAGKRSGSRTRYEETEVSFAVVERSVTLLDFIVVPGLYYSRQLDDGGSLAVRSESAGLSPAPV